ncbi:MAG: DUF86 domain-containing protein [Planctomycetes bacterium]|nr:DUF86 domain-containing protein [Planctomycetota bacterium]
MKDDRLHLRHVLECASRIEAYVTGGRAEFLRSTLVQDAVLRNLQTLAESTQRISEERKTAHPSVPWRALAGFRNILVHGYLGVDLEQVWRIVELELPSLRIEVERMLLELDV